MKKLRLSDITEVALVIGISKGVTKGYVNTFFLRSSIVADNEFLYCEGVSNRTVHFHEVNIVEMARSLASYLVSRELRCKIILNGRDFNFLEMKVVACDPLENKVLQFFLATLKRFISASKKRHLKIAQLSLAW